MRSPKKLLTSYSLLGKKKREILGPVWRLLVCGLRTHREVSECLQDVNLASSSGWGLCRRKRSQTQPSRKNVP